MALMRVHFNYNADSDLLSVSLPDVAENVKGVAAVMPFTEDETVPPLSFVLFLGYDDVEDNFTGEITGFEMPFFARNYPLIRDAMQAHLSPLLPQPFVENGKLTYDVSSVSLARLDEDIKTDARNVIFLSELMNLLDSFYIDVDGYVRAPETERQAREVEHTRQTAHVQGRLTTSVIAA